MKMWIYSKHYLGHDNCCCCCDERAEAGEMGKKGSDFRVGMYLDIADGPLCGHGRV
jgi:hypothetical protein